MNANPLSMAGHTQVFYNKDLRIIFGVTLIAVMGVASVTPAFPAIIKVLNISPAEVGLLVTVFTLPGIILTPVLGVYADIYGRKKILIPSLFLFSLAGIACGFTRDFNVLLIFRFLQGVGASSLGSLNVTVIADLFSGKDRSSAMGYNASILSMGTAAYPLLGGALATLGWNYPFFLPILAIPVGLLVLISLKNPEPMKKLELKVYLKETFKSVRKKDALGLFIASTFTFIILYGSYLTYFPVLMDSRFRAYPWMIGLILSAMSVTTALAASQLGKLTARYSAKRLLLFAYLVYAVGLLLITQITSLWWLILPAIIFGLGHGINIPCIHTLLASMAPLEFRASFMSFNGMVLRLGQSLGPLIMGLVLGLSSLSGVFIAGAVFSLCMMGLLGIIMK